MSGYTNVFTGSQVVLPSARSYSALALSATTTLAWPSEGNDDSDLLTAILDVTPSTAGLQLRLPPGNEASPGSAAVVVNSGADSFDLRLNDGSSSVATVAAGTTRYVWLRTNTTSNGAWSSMVLGAGSVSPDLSSQAGAGLVYFNGLLNTGYPSEDVSSPTYSITEGDRASAVTNTGGALTVSFADLTTAFQDNFFFIARNSGSGTMTLDPSGSQLIDGATTVVLNQGQSCFVILNASLGEWVTIGRQSSSSTASVTAGVISAAGTGDLALSAAQVAFSIQEFQGLLTGNRTVTYGALTGVWYVYNNTTGAFTMTFRVNGSDSGVEVTQGQRAIITLNGTNATIAFTTTAGSGTVTSVVISSPLTGGTITTTGTVGLQNSGVSAGTYGSTAQWPQFVVDAKGLISSATGVALPSLPYLPTTGGTGTGTYALVGPLTVNSLTSSSAVVSGLGTFGTVNTPLVNFGAATGTSMVLSGAMAAASANVSGTTTSAVYGGTSSVLSGNSTAASFVGTSANISGTGIFGVLNATSAVFSGTGLAVNATAGTGAFGVLLVGGTAIAQYNPVADVTAPVYSSKFPVNSGSSNVLFQSGTGTTTSGVATITFATAFSAIPTVMGMAWATAFEYSYMTVNNSTLSATAATFTRISTVGSSEDVGFWWMAQGPTA